MKNFIRILTAAILLFTIACNDSTERRDGNNDSMRYDNNAGTRSNAESTPDTIKSSSDSAPATNMYNADTLEQPK